MTWKPTIKPAQKSQQEFSSVADGTHKVNGVDVIAKWMENDLPIFRLSQDTLKLGLKFRKVDGTEGPAMSVTAPELYALALVFGVNLADLKPRYNNRTDGNVVNKLIELINEKKTAIEVTSRNGWTNRIAEMRPPIQQYTFSFQGFSRPDRQPGYAWQIFGDSESLIATFVIEGDANGTKNLWSGYPISMWFNNGFTTEVEAEDGKHNAYDDGRFFFRPNYLTGDITKAAKLWSAFGSLFLNEQLDKHVWQSDPALSDFGVDEMANPQVVFCNYAEEMVGKTVTGWLRQNGKYAVVDLEGILASSTSYSWEDENVLEPLIEFVASTFGPGLLSEEGTFTPKGKKWAKDYLEERKAWENAGLDLSNRELASLTSEQVTKLIEEIQRVNL